MLRLLCFVNFNWLSERKTASILSSYDMALKENTE